MHIRSSVLSHITFQLKVKWTVLTTYMPLISFETERALRYIKDFDGRNFITVTENSSYRSSNYRSLTVYLFNYSRYHFLLLHKESIPKAEICIFIIFNELFTYLFGIYE